MNYKEEYEAMVKRCRELHESGNALTKLQMEIVCPQLKESEDERIKKWLIAVIEEIKADDDWCADLNKCDEAIAWLEKQKEQKPESCDCSRDEESYTNGIHHVLMNPEVYGLIKQKPAEQLGGTFTSYDMAKTFTDGQNYVIAHPEKFGLCKPAEWKEKDEGMLNCIIATLCEESHGGRESNDKMVTWLENRLKSLRPQPHWKPSEAELDALEKIMLEVPVYKRPPFIENLYAHLKQL